MGICLICGKKGIFLKVNESGRCKDCEVAYRQRLETERAEKRAQAIQNYKDISGLYLSAIEKISAPDDPIERLKCIPQIEEKLLVCDKLLEMIGGIKGQEEFANALEELSDYDAKSDRYLKYAYFPNLDLKILVSQYSNESLLDKFVNELTSNATSAREQWKSIARRIKKDAEFELLLKNIPVATIDHSNEDFCKLATADLDEKVKYSSITAKTSFDRIGNFVVVDIETTGLGSVCDEIIEISAIRFEDWIPVEQYHSFVRPCEKIPDEIIDLTGITNEMVSGAPPFSSLIPSFEAFIGKSNLVGYNLPFDLKFIYRNGFDITTQKRKYFDVLEVAKKTLKKPKMKWDRELESYEINYDYGFDVENYKLNTVCEYYEIRDIGSAHRASADALATGLIFKKLAETRTGEMG